MNIYLDIDGVLIKDEIFGYGQPADHVLEFLEFITNKHNCFWLTTHCREGINRAPEFVLQALPEAKPFLEKITATDWDTWKTDAIDFSQDFRWIDDEVYKPEMDALISHNCVDKLIQINLRNNPTQLKHLISIL